jgi:hypothetical protein
MSEGKGKRTRKLANVSTAYLRAGAPESITQEQFTLLFLEVLRDRHVGTVTTITRQYSDLLFRRFIASAHVVDKPDALLCINALRNSYQMQFGAKTGTGRRCCFCGSKKQLNDVTLWKIHNDTLVPSGTFIVNKKYVVVLRALMNCNRIEDGVKQMWEEVKREIYERLVLYKESLQVPVSSRPVIKLMKPEECQLSLSRKKRELCEMYKYCFTIVWMVAGSDVFVIN